VQPVLGLDIATHRSVQRDQVPISEELVELEQMSPAIHAELDAVKDQEHVVRVGEDLGDVPLLLAVPDGLRMEVEDLGEELDRGVVAGRDVDPDESVGAFELLLDLVR
jgi:hypothetical protein